jgi:type I restriction enzyme R subunit
MKLIMTGGVDDRSSLHKHVRTKSHRQHLAERFKNPADELRLVIVVDMWLTGFDVPCAQTMYLDKPLAGHNLMQAIARVNRVYGEKPGRAGRRPDRLDRSTGRRTGHVRQRHRRQR